MKKTSVRPQFTLMQKNLGSTPIYGAPMRYHAGP